MYKRCITERSAKQQKSIEDSFLELLNSKPYQSITVSDLCQNAGIFRYTFYRLFECKDDVLDALVDRTLLAWLREQPSKKVTEDNLYQMNCAFFSFWEKQKSLLRALCENGKSSLLVERSVQSLSKEDVSVTGYFGADKNDHGDEIYRFCTSGVFSLVVNWHQTGYRKSIEQMAQILELLLKSALFHPNAV